MKVARDLYVAEQRAVDAEADARHRFSRFDMDIGGLLAHSLLKNAVHQPHDGSGVGGDVRHVLRRSL